MGIIIQRYTKAICTIILLLCVFSVFAQTNVKPTVTIISPINNSKVLMPASITLAANALDKDGTISKVEFYCGTAIIGVVKTPPYQFVWDDIITGTYVFTAKAYDNLGAVTTSASVKVIVTKQTFIPQNIPSKISMCWAYNLGDLAPGIGYDYTLQNLDEYQLHQVNVGFYNTIAQMTSMIKLAKTHKMPINVEIPSFGYDPQKDGAVSTKMGTNSANSWINSRLKSIKSHGVDSIGIINIDAWGYDAVYGGFKTAYPNLSQSDCLDSAVFSMLNYMKRITQVYPEVKFSLISALPHYAWKSYPGIVSYVNSKKYGTDYFPVMQRLVQRAKEQKVRLEGWTLDCPYNYFSIINGYDWMQAIIDIEHFLHQNGLKLGIISNTEAGSNSDFYKNSLNYVRNYQLKGGRADRYIVESWYTPVTDMVPETTDFTATRTMCDFLKYIHGTDQNLDLWLADGTNKTGINNYSSVQSSNQTATFNPVTAKSISYTMYVKNNATFYCLPSIYCNVNNANGWQATISYKGINITDTIISPDGWSPRAVLQVNDSLAFTITLTNPAIWNGAMPNVAFSAQWNPQDPHKTIKDVVGISGISNSFLVQNIKMNKGWNLISTNVHPTDSSITTLFTGLDVQEIKTNDSFWRKGQNVAFNGLKTISLGQGYLVYMNNVGVLSITGIGSTKTLQATSLQKGWNVVGCPYQKTTAISTIFNTTNTLSVKNLDGFWIPGGTLNSITNLESGKGYFVKIK